MNDCNSSKHEEMIAAAEERGRRRGVEERDELIAALRTVKCCAPDAGLSECKMLSAIQRLLRRYPALAPRDSGKDLEWPEDGT